MAASLKLSELTALTSVADADLLLVTDSSATESKKVTFSDLKSSLTSGLSVDDLRSAVGTTLGSGHMGTFTGSLIGDNTSVKAALQALETATELRATAASPQFTGNLATLIGGATSPVVHRIQGGFPDVILRTNGGDVDLNQNEGRLLWEDAGGGAVGAIKMTMLPAAPMRFFTKNITAAEEKMRITTDGRVGIGKTVPLAKLHVAGSCIIEADFPDFDLRSGGERRIIFQDAGGGAEAAIKSNGANLDIFVGGVGASDRVADFDTTGLTLDSGKALNLDSVALTTVQTSGESFADNDTSLMTSAAISDLIGSNGATLSGLGITATASELNVLDGITATTAELNYTDGVTSAIQTQLDAKAPLASPTLTGTVNLPAATNFAAASDLTLVDNTADALEIKEGSNQYVAITTTDNGEKVEVFKNLHLAGERLFFDTGTQLIRLSDNKTSALKIENHDGSSQDFLDFKTANSGPQLIFGAPNQVNNTITVGEDDTGYDVKFFGATASAYLLWDESADDLILAGDAGLVVPEGQFTLGSTAVTSTAAELNILDGVTSTAAELNILDGVTATAAELNILDGVTSTAAELNILDGVTATTAEVNVLDGATAGTAVASKAVVLDSNKDITGIRNFTITGNLSVQGTTTTVDTVTMEASNAIVFEGATADDHETTLTIVDPNADRTIKLPNQSGCLPVLAADSTTAITATPEELNILDGVTATAAELNILDGVTATAAELNYVDGVTSAIQTQLDAKAALAGATFTGNVTVHRDYPDITLKSNGERRLIFSDAGGGANAALKYASSELWITYGGVASGDVELKVTDGAIDIINSLKIGGTAITSTAAELNILDGVTATAAELNILDGVTSTAAELNILDGVTATAAELNILDGVTATAAELNILDGVTATAAELNILDGVTSTAAELNVLDGLNRGHIIVGNASNAPTSLAEGTEGQNLTIDANGDVVWADATGGSDFTGVTAGTVAAGKGVKVDSNKDITGFRNVTLTGELDAATLDISGDADIDGTTNLDAVDIDGATQIDGTVTVGVDDTGYDVKFFGATASAYMLWDESADDLILAGDAGLVVPEGKLTLGSTAVTSTAAELNILDGVTATAAELNILDGVTSTAAELNILDGVTSTAAELNILDGVTSTATELNLLDGTTAGTVVASKAVAVDANKDISGFRNVTLTGWLIAPILDISGNVDIDGITNLDAVDIDGATQIDGTVTVGVDDTGYDVKFFGATSGASLLWDESADELILAGAAGVTIPDGKLTLGSTAVTSTAAELNVLDGLNRGHIIVGNSSNAPTSLAEGTEGQNLTIDANGDVVWADASSSDFTGVTAGTVAASKGVKVDSNKDITGFRNVTLTGELDAATLDISGDADIDGTTNLDAVDIDGAVQADGTITVGVDDTGYDVKFFGATSGAYMLWDESEDDLVLAGAAGLDIAGDIDVDGTANLDNVDIDGNTNMGGNLTFSGGATNMVLTDNSTGALDIKEGTTSYMKFDTTNGSELITVAKDTNFTGAVKLGGTAITSTAAELNILDGVTATAAELNILDGVTSTAAELNILDGVTSTAAELNLLDGATDTTWTATLEGSTGNPGSKVTATGQYARMGKMVIATVHFNGVDTSSYSGDISISGLPVTSKDTATAMFMGNVYNNGMISGATDSVQALVADNGTTISFLENANGSALQWGTVGASKSMRVQVVYISA